MSEFEFELDLQELLDELVDDDSWEADPEVRKNIAFDLLMEISQSSG